MGFAGMLRGAAKLAWARNLPARLRTRRRASAAELESLIERVETLERGATEMPGVLARLEALEERVAAVQHALAQLDALEHSLAALDTEAHQGARRLEALERHAADLQGLFPRMEVLEQAAPDAEHAAKRLEHVEAHATFLDTFVRGERLRTDWALAAFEGVTAQIAAYHAYRETDEYRAAYTVPEPLVSVCVATLDRAEVLLQRAIPSLLAQTYRNLQIVVVGDNCTDDTMQRLAAVGDSRIQFVNLPERGPYPRPGLERWCVAGTNAINCALSLCEGQFITHLDDDDSMAPRRIELMLAAALEHRADFLWHAFLYQNQDGSWLRLGNGQLEMGQITTGSIFYHRYFARVRWDLYAYRLSEPGDWNRLRKIRVLRPRLRYIDEPLLHHFKEHSQPDFVPREGERFLE